MTATAVADDSDRNRNETADPGIAVGGVRDRALGAVLKRGPRAEDKERTRASQEYWAAEEPHAMSRDAEMTTNPPTAAVRSAAAERMRRHRERRREGLRCVTLDVHDGEIDALARRGFLKDDARNDLRSIEMALYKFLEHALG
jgi:hypothetical protein